MLSLPSSRTQSSSSLPATAQAHHAGTSNKPAFRNPWTEQPSSPGGAFNYAEWLNTARTRAQSLPSLEWAREHPASARVRPVKVVKPDFTQPDPGYVKATWLGHAGYLVQLPGVSSSVVFDPMFSERAGPSQGSYAVGPARFAPPPCAVQDLPDDVQFVCISHNHYDHLDLTSILGIYAKRGKGVTFLVPLGNKAWFVSCGVPDEQVIEFDWWEDFTLTLPFSGVPRTIPSTTSFASSLSGYTTAPTTPGTSTPNLTPGNSSPSIATLRITCVPAQHSSGRSVTDQRTTLWCGWIVELFASSPSSPPSSESEDITTPYETPSAPMRRLASVYHAGDTGYVTPRGPAPFFAEIGERFGPLDLALVPIWRGGSLGFVAAMGLRLVHAPSPTNPLSALHASPSEGRAIARAVNARHALAMHFATFVGSAHEASEPIVELALLRQSESEPDGAKNRSQDEVLGPETQVLNRETLDAGAGAGLSLWGKKAQGGGVLRKLTSLSNRGSRSNSRAGSRAGSGDEAEPDAREGEDEAGRWKDEGGFGWVDIGGSALVPLA
ncbi:Metallo-hydrolase/oxidoreductase [Exidia glandulosa HHB12029]|uniref:Metallo-hydrolase/oxidoreductase n=1 Tax=Exidia glandulosa HHB12029 TaxID=1314781 RepID=A0A165DLN9_EXIGL|nr:Metallo-hydrolase/oxidoreductase [Exidia glandulosa HHB12029]